MEWLQGEDLGHRLQRMPLNVSEALALCGRVCEGLSAAHERGIVHRDIKPTNLFLVDQDPLSVKILDFGIARVRETTHAATKTGSVLGTPGYMAPEQARADDTVGAEADVFSLGCVLYECLTGKPAFAGVHFMAILAKILLEPAPRVRELRPDISAALDDLVAHMLDKDPTRRLPDAAAVGSELLRIDTAFGETVSIEATGAPLTGREQSLLCVLLIGNEKPRADAAEETLTAADGGAALHEIVARHAGKLECLGDDNVVVVFEPRAAATDLAQQAARCALDLRALFPDAQMALATGQGVVQGRVPIGAVIDRAAPYSYIFAAISISATSRHEGLVGTGRPWFR